MKNREKFKDEIIDIVCNGGNLAVDKEKIYSYTLY